MSETAILVDLSPARRRLAFSILLIGSLIPSLNMFIVTIALPSMRDALNASESQTSLIVTGYSAAFSVCLITGGRLADLYGRRLVYVLGVVGFTLGSLTAGLAPSPVFLVIGRILQGMFGAAMVPPVLASLRALFKGDEIPRALNIYGTGVGVAVAGGQLLGGVLIAADIAGLGWRAPFLINVPIGIALIGLALAFVPESGGSEKPRLDIIGVILLSTALGSFVVGLSLGRESGWPPWVIGMIVASPLLLALFFVFEKRVSREGGMPLIDPALLRIKTFSRGLIVALLFFFTMPFYIFFSIYLQAGLGEGALAAGLAVLPYGVANFLGPLSVTRARPRLRRRLFGLGMALQIFVGYAGVGLCAWTQTGGVPLFLALFAGGFGQGVAMPEMIHFILGDVPPAHTGLAAGAMNSTLQIGAAVSVASIGSLFFVILGGGSGAAAYGHALGITMAAICVMLTGSMLLGLWTQARR
ncbi:MAG TPA: MFS transporter [Stellaceae bacterium]|jgi:MFS family permease|nr:MFS transporter [Stellaceae bacterium]